MRLPATRRGRALLGGLVAAQVVSSVLAWRDLARRPADRVRGGRTLWRVLVTVNPGNSIAYWLLGRR